MLYRFSAFREGKARLFFAYGPIHEQSQQPIARITVHVKIIDGSKEAGVAKPAPRPQPADTPEPPPTPTPPAPLVAQVDWWGDDPTFTVTVGQLIEYRCVLCDGCFKNHMMVVEPQMDGVLEKRTTNYVPPDPNTGQPALQTFVFVALAPGVAVLPFNYRDHMERVSNFMSTVTVVPPP